LLIGFSGQGRFLLAPFNRVYLHPCGYA
jgi:hypothetical protein